MGGCVRDSTDYTPSAARYTPVIRGCNTPVRAGRSISPADPRGIPSAPSASLAPLSAPVAPLPGRSAAVMVHPMSAPVSDRPASWRQAARAAIACRDASMAAALLLDDPVDRDVTLRDAAREWLSEMDALQAEWEHAQALAEVADVSGWTAAEMDAHAAGLARGAA